MIKFKYGLPDKLEKPTDLDDSWVKMPPAKNSIIKGLALGLVFSIALSEIIAASSLLTDFTFSFLKNAHIFLVVIIAHEFIHILFLPNPGNATVGVCLRKLIFYVTTTQTISRNRFMIILLAPTLLLTVLPITILFFYQHKLLAVIAICNLLGAGIDLLNYAKLQKIKSDTLFRFYGKDLYVKDIS